MENQYSIRSRNPQSEMSALLLPLAGDATVRGTTTRLDSVNLACQKWNV
jgi:hypothetical protein